MRVTATNVNVFLSRLYTFVRLEAEKVEKDVSQAGRRTRRGFGSIIGMGQVREEKRKHAEKRKRRGIREDEKERERERGGGEREGFAFPESR